MCCTVPNQRLWSTSTFVHGVLALISLFHTSLSDVEEHANMERFHGLPSLLPHLCPLSVPKGWVCGVYSESP